MKAYILVYENFAHFEVILASYFLKQKYEIITVGVDSNPVTSVEGYSILPHVGIDEVKIGEIDIFIIPGGDPINLANCNKLNCILAELNSRRCIIGAICGGVIHLGRAGVLENRIYTTSVEIESYTELPQDSYVNENVVVDKNIITAKATGYVDFAIELGKMAKIYEDEADLSQTIDFFKS